MVRLFGFVLALSFFVTACGGSSSSVGSSPRGSSPSGASPSASAASLNSLTLTDAEATQAGGVPVSVSPAQNGNGLHGPDSSTLDLCGKAYPSEAMRTERQQVLYEDVQHPKRVIESNELVRYRSGGAAQAYAEVTAAAKNCPAQTTNGVRTSKVTVLPRSPQLATKQLTVAFALTPPKGRRIYTASVYQYIGNLFTGCYVTRLTHDDAVRAAVALAAASYGKVSNGSAA